MRPGGTAQPAASQGRTGTIVGVVRAEPGSAALLAAPITVLSTDLTVLSERDGAFQVIAPAGPQDVRVRLPGYREVLASVVVPAGGTAELEVVFGPEHLIEDVVVTGEGMAPEPLTPEAELAEAERAAAVAEVLASPDAEPDAESEAGQPALGTAAPLDVNVRFRGRVLDEAGDLGDPSISSFSLWSKTKIGNRIVTNVTYDLGRTRMHDFWAQFDVGGGFQIRAGRSSLAWFGEFTESSHSRQTIQAAVGARLTRSRETGIFMFWDRGAYNARLHVVQGSGYEAENNSWKDVLGSVGRTFDIAGSSVLVDAGHYEGRDGPDDALVPRRQTGFYFEGELDGDRDFRGAAFRREQLGREHFGGFVRFRHRFPQGIWAVGEFGTESNYGPLDAPLQASYVVVGSRYELPWTMTHLSADYRRSFGWQPDHELLLLFQWLFDFQNPRRN